MSEFFIIEKKEVDFQQFATYWSAQYNYNKPLEWALDNLSFSTALLSPGDIKSLFLPKDEPEAGFFRLPKLTAPLDMMKGVDTLNKLKKNYDQKLFEKEFGHLSSIAQILLLQYINPASFPMFDKHIYRGFAYLTTQRILELEDLSKTDQFDAYIAYKSFIMAHVSDNLPLKKADKAIWAFGKFLDAEHAKYFLSRD